VGLAGSYDDASSRACAATCQRCPTGIARSSRSRRRRRGRAAGARRAEGDTGGRRVLRLSDKLRRGDSDWIALWLARSWLGEHRSSSGHLYQRIRELRGMNYGDYAYIEYFPSGMFQFQPDANLCRQQQIFQIWLRPLRTNNDAQFATRAALFELEKLVHDGMTQEDFEATRNFLDKHASLLVKTQSAQLATRSTARTMGSGRLSTTCARASRGSRSTR
jgi:zinc protease